MPSHAANARVFKALCDPRRLRVLELLQSGEQCVCVLLEKLHMPQSTLSYHLKILCDSGIVVKREDGKWCHYRISEEGARAAAALLDSLTRVESQAVTPAQCAVVG